MSESSRIPAEGRFIEHPVGGKHQCPLPPQWSMGALWQCPEGHLWVVDVACECRDMRGHDQGHHGMHSMGLAWWPATWWQRRKYGPGMRRADLSMAQRSERKQYGVTPSPPKGPSGVSHPPTDFDG